MVTDDGRRVVLVRRGFRAVDVGGVPSIYNRAGEQPEEALAIAMRYTGMPHDTIKEAMAHMRYAPDIDKEKAGEFAGFLSDLNYLSPDRGQHRQLVFFQ